MPWFCCFSIAALMAVLLASVAVCLNDGPALASGELIRPQMVKLRWLMTVLGAAVHPPQTPGTSSLPAAWTDTCA